MAGSEWGEEHWGTRTGSGRVESTMRKWKLTDWIALFLALVPFGVIVAILVQNFLNLE